ncbi:MAG: branched-chain amino acid aminotransferase [Acidimicrobiia bacterium]|nr:branched-chain amino acid aminotransferase [Acidimicrobiia bacterium]
MRAYWNESAGQLFVFRLDDHSNRLEQSVRLMRMDSALTASDFSTAVLRTLRENAVRQTVHIRQMVYVDGQGEMFGVGPIGHAVVVTPKGGWFDDKPGVHACFSSWQRISDHSMPPRIKCAANYQNGRLALLQARLDGYDSVILLNSAGKVAEEPRACVFVRRGNQVATPPITSGILESITRSTLIQLFGDLHGIEVIEREIDRTEFYLADEAFICGTGLEVVPILSIDRHQIAKGQPGRLTTTVREQYFQAARGEMPQYQHWLTLC